MIVLNWVINFKVKTEIWTHENFPFGLDHITQY